MSRGVRHNIRLSLTVYLIETLFVFLDSVFMISVCLTNVVDAAFTPYFIHHSSVVDNWDFASFVGLISNIGVLLIDNTRMPTRCRLYLIASPSIGSYESFIEAIHSRSNEERIALLLYFSMKCPISFFQLLL